MSAVQILAGRCGLLDQALFATLLARLTDGSSPRVRCRTKPSTVLGLVIVQELADHSSSTKFVLLRNSIGVKRPALAGQVARKQCRPGVSWPLVIIKSRRLFNNSDIAESG